MKKTHNILGLMAITVIMTGWFLGGCGHKVQRSPSLTKVPEAPDRPHDKSFLDKAADTTWGVVSAPVRWVVPAKKKPAVVQEPEPYEPVDVVILRRDGQRWIPEEKVAEKVPEPAATQPK